MLSRSLLALAFVLGLAGGASSKILRYSGTPYDLYYNGNPKRFKINSIADSILFTLTVPSEFKTLDNQTFITTDQGTMPYYSWLANPSALKATNANLIGYEQNSCNTPDGKIYGLNLKPYLTVGTYRSRFYCRHWGYGIFNCQVNGWGTPSEPANAVFSTQRQSKTGSEPYPQEVMNCQDRSGVDLFVNATIRAEEGPVTDTCSYGTRGTCNVCSWPYLSEPDTVGCGCKVDRSKYQSQQLLQTRTFLYCATYSDGSGSQYYLDLSRSNFDPAKGSIRGACSSPETGSTVYVPVGTCPSGTRLVDSVQDSTGQDARGTIDEPKSSGSGGGSGSDEGTHSRLDSIIGILRDTSGIGEKRDSLNSWDSAARESLGDTVTAKYRLSTLDSAINAIPGSDGPCLGCVDPWHCDKIPNDSIAFDFWGTHMSIPLPISEITSQMPFDFWATMRLIQWLLVTLMMLGPWLWIAGANVGKGGS